MEFRKLKGTDENISVFTLGLWNSANSDSRSNQLLDIRIIDQYIAAGGNALDTAVSYGSGRSEELIGEYLKNSRSRSKLFISTKAGINYCPERVLDGSKNALLRDLEGSLRRMGTDYIDLWQLHTWDPKTPIEHTLEAYQKAVEQGKVRFVGMSNFSADQAIEMNTSKRKSFPNLKITSLQYEYSLLNRFIEAYTLPFLKESNINFFAWAPLAGGTLTGKYLKEMPEESRGNNPKWAFLVSPYFNLECIQFVKDFLSLCVESGIDPVHLAISWLISKPYLSSIIIGPRTEEQLTLYTSTSNIHLDQSLFTKLDEMSNFAVNRNFRTDYSLGIKD